MRNASAGHHRVFEFGFLGDPTDQPCRERFFGGEPVAGRQHREGALVPQHCRGEQAGRRFGHEAEIHERRAEHGAPRGIGQVAVQVERRADADRDPVHPGQDGLARAGERLQEIPDLAPFLPAGRNAQEVGKVVAR